MNRYIFFTGLLFLLSTIHAQTTFVCESWNEVNINAAAGNTSFGACANNSITITTDVTGYTSPYNADYQLGVYRQVCGDGEFVVEISDTSNGSAIAGMEIRANHDPGSIKVGISTLMSLFHKNVRTTTDGNATVQGQPSNSRRYYKLTRTGSNVRIYNSPTGVAWYLKGSYNLSLEQCIEIGVFVRSNNGASVTATFDNIEISGFTEAPVVQTEFNFSQASVSAYAGTEIDICVDIPASCACSSSRVKVKLKNSTPPEPHLLGFSPVWLDFSGESTQECFTLPIGDANEAGNYKLILKSPSGGNSATIGSTNIIDVNVVPVPEQMESCSSWEQNQIGNAAGNTDFVYCDNASFDISGTAPFSEGAASDNQIGLYRPVCGNGEAVVEVVSASNGFTGLEFRNTLDVGSERVMLVSDKNDQHLKGTRTQAGTAEDNHIWPSFDRHWLKLERIGNSFRGYASVDGLTWFLKFAYTVPMNSCIYVGVIGFGDTASPFSTAVDGMILTGFTEYESGNTPNVGFTENSITASVGTTVDVCINLAESCACLPTSVEVVESSVSDSIGFSPLRLNFPNGETSQCFSLAIPADTEAGNYQFSLQQAEGGNGTIIGDNEVLEVVVSGETSGGGGGGEEDEGVFEHAFRLISVEFAGHNNVDDYIEIYKDSAEADNEINDADKYTGPQWLRGLTSETITKQPIAYVRGSTMKIEAKFSAGCNVPHWIRGVSSQGIIFPAKMVTAGTDGIATYDFEDALNSLPNTVNYWPSFDIHWEYNEVNAAFPEIMPSTGWVYGDFSRHTVYLTLGAPITTPLPAPPGATVEYTYPLESMLFISCKNANGQYTTNGLVTIINGQFAARKLQRVSDPPNQYLSYWGEGTICDADNDEGEVDNDPLCFSPTGVLAAGCGRCEGFAELFIDMLRIHGIGSARKIVVYPKDGVTLQVVGSTSSLVLDSERFDQFSEDITNQLAVNASSLPAMPAYFFVKHWTFDQAVENLPTRKFYSSKMTTAPSFVYPNGYELVGTDLTGLKSQGNDNPIGFFTNHAIVMYEDQYYDPSYGTGPFASQNEWENASIAGFGTTGEFIEEFIWYDIINIEYGSEEQQTVFIPYE